MALLDWFPEIHLRLSMHYCPNGAPFRWLRMGTGRMGTEAALTTILYVYETPDNNRTRTIVYC